MAAERIPGGFGSKLREARERRGISLRQIANATKISIGALEALERNQLSRLPGGIFSRAFVRSYAIEVGLDPDATIQEFIAQFPRDSLTAGVPCRSTRGRRSPRTPAARSAFLRLLRSACRSPASCFLRRRPPLAGAARVVSREESSARPAVASPRPRRAHAA